MTALGHLWCQVGRAALGAGSTREGWVFWKLLEPCVPGGFGRSGGGGRGRVVFTVGVSGIAWSDLEF